MTVERTRTGAAARGARSFDDDENDRDQRGPRRGEWRTSAKRADIPRLVRLVAATGECREGIADARLGGGVPCVQALLVRAPPRRAERRVLAEDAAELAEAEADVGCRARGRPKVRGDGSVVRVDIAAEAVERARRNRHRAEEVGPRPVRRRGSPPGPPKNGWRGRAFARRRGRRSGCRRNRRAARISRRRSDAARAREARARRGHDAMRRAPARGIRRLKRPQCVLGLSGGRFRRDPQLPRLWMLRRPVPRSARPRVSRRPSGEPANPPGDAASSVSSLAVARRTPPLTPPPFVRRAAARPRVASSRARRCAGTPGRIGAHARGRRESRASPVARPRTRRGDADAAAKGEAREGEERQRRERSRSVQRSRESSISALSEWLRRPAGNLANALLARGRLRRRLARRRRRPSVACANAAGLRAGTDGAAAFHRRSCRGGLVRAGRGFRRRQSSAHSRRSRRGRRRARSSDGAPRSPFEDD